MKRAKGWVCARKWLTAGLSLALMLLPLQPALASFHYVDGGQTPPKDAVCVPWEQLKDGGRYASPLAVGEVKFYSEGLWFNMPPFGRGLHFALTFKVLLPRSDWVQLTFTHDGPALLTAHDASGAEVARQAFTASFPEFQTVTLTGSGIVQLTLRPGFLRPTGEVGERTGDLVEGYVLSLCYRPTSAQDQQPPPQDQNKTAGLPDLSVALTGPAAAEPGGNVTGLVVTVKNQGSASAPGSRPLVTGYMVDLVLSRDGTLPIRFATYADAFAEDVLLGGGRVSNTDSLAPGESRSYTVSEAVIPADTPPGLYCLGAVVDPGNAVAESDEGNNTQCHWITIGKQGPEDQQQPPQDQQQPPPEGQQGVVAGCLDFRKEKAGDRADVFVVGGITFSADGGASVLDLDGDGALELYFTGTLKAVLPAGASQVKATLVHFGDQVTMEAFDATGASKGVRTTAGSDGSVETLEINAGAAVITRVILSTKGKAALVSLCREGGPREWRMEKGKACERAPFADVPVNHPACGAIALMAERGIIGGFKDRTFRPNQPVTRAEFAKLLVLAMGRKPDPAGRVDFRDARGHWSAAQGYLQAAVALGAIGGFPDGTVRPDTRITRAQGIKIAAASAKMFLLGADGGGVPGDPLGPRGFRPPFNPPGRYLTDVGTGAWYEEWVGLAFRGDLMGPEAPYPVFTESRLLPDMPMTRAEAAQVLANLLLRRLEAER